MKDSNVESWRLRYLRILTTSPDKIGDSQDDLQAMEDLIEMKYFRAQVLHDKHGVVRSVGGLLIPTLQGRLFVEDQQAIRRSKTLVGRFKSNWPLFSGIIGIFAGWSLGLLTPYVQHGLYPLTQQPDKVTINSTREKKQPVPPSTTAPSTPSMNSVPAKP